MRVLPRTGVYAIALILVRGAGAEGAMVCPHAVSFDPLPVPKPQTVETAWVTPDPSRAEFAVPDFFKKGDGLTMRCSSRTVEGKQERSVELARGADVLATFTGLPFLGHLIGRQTVHVADYDGNGRNDIKFVVSLGGCGGNANNGIVYYVFQHEREWRLVSYFIRDRSYAWECDLNGDGRFELLKGHHQDKRKPGYHDRKTDRWVSVVFRKYLVINAYEIGPNGLTLRNDLSGRFPMIIPFTTDPFEVSKDKEFLSYNQFKLPQDYYFGKAPLRGR